MLTIHPVHIIIVLSVLLAIAVVKAGFLPRRRAAREAAPAKRPDELRQMKDRLAVLERLAIERDASSLELEIERLRDR